MIRNAGGRASDDAIRSLVISYKLLGTNEWFVIHHTNCGMEFFTDEVIRGLLANSLETAALGAGRVPRRRHGPGIGRGQVHRLADDRDNQSRAWWRTWPGSGLIRSSRQHPDLRLHLRRDDREAGRGTRGHRSRSGGVDGSGRIGVVASYARRSFDAHSALDAFDRRSLAAGLNRCSAPCGVMPPTASPISRQLAPPRRASSADAWPRRSAERRSWSANRSVASATAGSPDTSRHGILSAVFGPEVGHRTGDRVASDQRNGSQPEFQLCVDNYVLTTMC